MYLNLIFLGAPGAGKGTQAKLLSEKLGIPTISSGEILRDNICRRTRLGLEAQDFVERGELVPDDLVVSMITSVLRLPAYQQNGALLDGFPRSIEQAKALTLALKTVLNQEIYRVFYIKVGKGELAQRLSGRSICPVCNTTYHDTKNPPLVTQRCNKEGATLYRRSDDTYATTLNRLQVYFNHIIPLVDYYDRKGLLEIINGEQSVEKVNSEIYQKLGEMARTPQLSLA